MSAEDLPGHGTLAIGEVFSILRGEFPDITISKLRFLEQEGLVKPDRTPAGYRKFSHVDVERVRYVLSQQRDNFLPLRVIKDQLDQLDRGLRPIGPDGVPRDTAMALGDTPDAEDFRLEPAALRLTREDLLHAAGLREDQLDQLEQFGLVTAGRGGRYDDDALAVAKIVAELGRYGLEGRHLRPFRSAAEREVGLFEQVVEPLRRQRSTDARQLAQDRTRELAALSVQLHAALVRAGLRQSLGGH